MIGLAFPKTARSTEKRAQKTTEDRTRREVYALIDRRDDFRCRPCKRRVSPSAIAMLERAHHHHIRFRSQGGKDETSVICLTCRECHDAVHVTRELTITGNADSTLTFQRHGKTWHN